MAGAKTLSSEETKAFTKVFVTSVAEGVGFWNH